MNDEGREQRLRQARAIGELVDYTHSEEKEVPAALLVQLLIAPLQPGEIRRAVKLAGATIAGELDLDATTLLCPLSLSKCVLPSPIVLTNADAPSVELTRCWFRSLDARQLDTRGNLDLTDSETLYEHRRSEERVRVPRPWPSNAGAALDHAARADLG